jgi:flagellin-like hook-associated protein FlgL
MASIITNQSALQALQAVNAASRDLAATQRRVSTGLKVANAKDNGAIYVIAQGMRAEVGAWSAAMQSVSRASSALDVTAAALDSINNLLSDLKELGVAYADLSLPESSRRALRADMEAHISQIDRQAKEASFDGLNFLHGVGVAATVFSTAQYSLASSTKTPLSFLTPMSSGANTAVSRSMTTTTDYAIPRSALTPDSFTKILGLRQVASGTSVATDRMVFSSPANVGFDRSNPRPWPEYGTAGRVDLWLDAFASPNSFEVWHGGQRVAASGQPYIAGAGVTGPTAPVVGQTMLSFDYDPAKGKSYEIRATGAGEWAFEYNYERGPGQSAASAPSSHPVGVTSRSDWPAPGPPIDLRPETSGPSPALGGAVSTPVIDGGVHAGRVDLLFDAFETADIVEIYQNGVRVAATGQPAGVGGSAVAAGVPVSGQQVLSFDYDPANGQSLEFKFNENNSHAGAGWVVGGIELYPFGSPATTANFQTTTAQIITTSTFREAFESIGSDPLLLTPETEAVGSASKSYILDAGSKHGRVDLWVDAYADADIIEVWQNGVRVGASGELYASGGAGVSPGSARSGDVFISFDYDPAKGQQLEFKFNADNPLKTGAWTVGGLVLQDIGAPPPTSTQSTTFPEPGEVFPDLEFIRSADGDDLLIASRNMTASGLRLTGLDWDDPADLLSRIGSAVERAIKAASYFGTQQSHVELSLRFMGRLQDALETGIGNLVDADLAKESARLQAQQVRQQLAVQSLSVANSQPNWLLSLFER